MPDSFERRLPTSFLERLRLEEGFSLGEQATRVGVPAGTLRRLELKGSTRTSPSVLTKLSDHYGMSIAELNDDLIALAGQYAAAAGGSSAWIR